MAYFVNTKVLYKVSSSNTTRNNVAGVWVIQARLVTRLLDGIENITRRHWTIAILDHLIDWVCLATKLPKFIQGFTELFRVGCVYISTSRLIVLLKRANTNRVCLWSIKVNGLVSADLQRVDDAKIVSACRISQNDFLLTRRQNLIPHTAINLAEVFVSLFQAALNPATDIWAINACVVKACVFRRVG